jgi:hypothetical protein
MDTYYVLFGNTERRLWPDARRYGFVSGGGGRQWSGPIRRLSAGDEVLVHVPRNGYVGHGTVVDEAVPIRDFDVEHSGQRVPLLQAPLDSPKLDWRVDDDEGCEWVARVRWITAVPLGHGYWRRGLPFRRNTTAVPFPDDETAAEIKSALTRESR